MTKPSEYPERMLKALVKVRDCCPAMGVDDPTILPTKWHLARNAGIVSARELELAEKYAVSRNSCFMPQELTVEQEVRRLVGVAGDLDAAMHEMKERGWILTWEDHAWPTKDGLDHGRLLMRTWYRKAFDAVKSDIRTIVVAVITAVIVTIATTLIIQLLD